jgi:leucyl-tRNA synthetase
MKYNHSKIESKWQKTWLKEKIYEPDLKNAKNPFYNLMMFPYPSAEGLHVGNMYAFTGTDIYGRLKRMQGYDVFEPIGLDGFGIHSENYALKIGKHPADQAKISEKNFYRQLGMIGNGFAWNERLETYDPEYYKWTQWIFTKMYENGLAYRKKSAVNWCPSCMTVLADEQVIGGECERCGTKVIKKDLEQWFFKITKYADRLLKGLDEIDWSEKVKIAQKNWIGRSEGAVIKFKIKNENIKEVEVFTTRPDTLFGATFMAVSVELAEKWIEAGWPAGIEVVKYIKEHATPTPNEGRSTEKTGVFTGLNAINPVNNKEIPIWVADYVLSGYGSGAVMCVPAHDERDYEFAKKYKLPIITVIEPVTGEVREKEEYRKSIVAIVENPATGKFLSLNWGDKLGGNLFIGGGIEKNEDEIQTATREIIEETGYRNLKFISKTETIHHHYVAFSKNVNRNIDAVGLHFQLVNDEADEQKLEENEKNRFQIEWFNKSDVQTRVKDELHSLVFKRLILGQIYDSVGKLTNSEKFNGMDCEKAKWEITKLVGGERKIQYRLRDWLISRQRYWGAPIPMIYCPSCAEASKGKENAGWQTVPEKDLPVKLPYIKEFRPTGTNQSPLASNEKFYKTKCPKCGGDAKRETDVSDTFLDSAWYYIGYLLKSQISNLKSQNFGFDEDLIKKWLPVNMYIGGAEHSVLHLLYVRFLSMAMHDIGLVNFPARGGSASGRDEPFTKFRAHGLLIKDGAKMSKSKGNVINPDDYIKQYSADALRMYLMFLGPFDQGGDFRDSGIKGVTRFLERVWKLCSNSKFEARNPKQIEKNLHKAIKKVTEDLESLNYNTAVSALMILLNDFESNQDSVGKKEIEAFIKLLAPFAPHMTEEIYQTLINAEKNAEERGKDQRQSAPSQRKSAFNSIHLSEFPKYDTNLIRDDEADIIVQINGKMRALVKVKTDLVQSEVEKIAKSDDNVNKYITGQIKKVIFVKNKLINFVL